MTDFASFEKVRYERRDRVAIITINRPDVMNAIDPQTSYELRKAWEDFRDSDDLWVAILTGAGDRAFSAGNDLVAMAKLMAGQMQLKEEWRGVPFGGITRDFECWKPMIAAINGFCLAGGLEMALSCDIRVASEDAQFGLPEVTRAIIPGASGTQRLPRAVPLGIALELLMTGGRIDAQTALRYGLVNHVVPKAQVMDKALEIAGVISKNGPLAVRAVKEAAIRGLSLPFEEGLKLENELSRRVLQSEDALEGPRAFAEKREPRYQGR